ncbi:7643_t:CDS:2 [Funneliformis geosporum]|uniref:16887_t:CDS:1 n=1 Tax=Funneliformis geosporum TaxID=1117311 RepID=A0A9W4SBR6_9GLOM|nr:16887_t:CDS:2 [Funneliformis geosporum]CAI2161714.1 7643_t:CDS:2 [Funneliformis geosporum]
MATYFDNLQRKYSDVPITNDGIETLPFLEATEGVVKLFDLLNSKAFTVVQNDMNGNILKIRNRYNTDPKKNNTLEKLVINEKDEKKRTATEGLLWLKRGLEFTSVALRRSIESSKSANGAEELSVSFTKAYEDTLKKFHGMLVRPVFKLAMSCCPYRKEFFEKLGEDQEKVNRQFEEWLISFEKVIEILNNFYKDGERL